MKKTLLLLLLTAGVSRLHAQNLLQLTPTDTLKQVPYQNFYKKGQDSLMKQLSPLLKFNQLQAGAFNNLSLNNQLVMISPVDNMPIARLSNSSKMPVLKPAIYSKMPALPLNNK